MFKKTVQQGSSERRGQASFRLVVVHIGLWDSYRTNSDWPGRDCLTAAIGTRGIAVEATSCHAVRRNSPHGHRRCAW